MDKNLAFTKGPWRFWDDVLCANVKGNNQLGRMKWFRANNHNAEANARLIAKAPELKETCQSLLNLIIGALIYQHGDKWWTGLKGDADITEVVDDKVSKAQKLLAEINA